MAEVPTETSVPAGTAAFIAERQGVTVAEISARIATEGLDRVIDDDIERGSCRSR